MHFVKSLNDKVEETKAQLDIQRDEEAEIAIANMNSFDKVAAEVADKVKDSVKNILGAMNVSKKLDDFYYGASDDASYYPVPTNAVA